MSPWLAPPLVPQELPSAPWSPPANRRGPPSQPLPSGLMSLASSLSRPLATRPLTTILAAPLSVLPLAPGPAVSSLWPPGLLATRASLATSAFPASWPPWPPWPPWPLQSTDLLTLRLTAPGPRPLSFQPPDQLPASRPVTSLRSGTQHRHSTYSSPAYRPLPPYIRPFQTGPRAVITAAAASRQATARQSTSI
jgi:hypothetical protein